MFRSLIAFVAAMLLAGSLARAQQGITLDVRGAQLSDVVALLATQSHQNIILDGGVPQTNVTIHLTNVSVHQALSAIESAYGLSEVRHDRYLALVPVKSALGAGAAGNNFTIRIDIPNGNAVAIAQTLSGVVQNQAFVSAVDPRTIVLSGDAQTVTRAEQLAQQLGGGTDYDYETVPVRYQPPTSVLSELSAMHVSDGVPIFANDAASSLLVGGSRSTRDNIKRVIAGLDVPTSVVTFDMFVLEVQPLNEASNRGVMFGQTLQGQSGQISITPGAAVATISGSGFRPSIGVQINELLSQGHARILASPKLVVPSGKQNEFKNGGQYPIAVQNGGLIGGQNVQYFPFGIDVIIGATVGANGALIGTIKASDSDISAFDPASHLPVIANRSDVVEDIPMSEGEPIVISGMFSDTQSDVLQKLPVLGDIPLLGGFFRNRQTAHTQDQLMFIIIPHRGAPKPGVSLQQELQGVAL